MSKHGATYDRSDVPCKGKRVMVGAKGLVLGACELKDTACIMVYLSNKHGRKDEREFAYWACKLGIQVRRCEVGAEAYSPTAELVRADIEATGSVAFECYGSLEALDVLRDRKCIKRWEFMMSGAPSVRLNQAGSGPEKVIAKKKFADPEVCEWTETHNACRDAVRDGDGETVDSLLPKLAKNKV